MSRPLMAYLTGVTVPTSQQQLQFLTLRADGKMSLLFSFFASSFAMASSLRSLVNDDSRYQKCFQLFLERSSEHQSMRDFIHNVLPDILGR